MSHKDKSRTLKKVFFVGNGSYQNRGCEAIVRGTMEILRQRVSPDLDIEAGSYGDPNTIQSQTVGEIDPAIKNFRLTSSAPRWSRHWFESQANHRIGTNFAAHHATLKNRIKDRQFALEIGGDNYSLDYGIPRHLLAMDNFLQSHGVPVVVWGASIGPFNREPEFEQEIFSHLRKLKAVFVRESLTYKYLTENGVTGNVHLVADPAFVMEPAEPSAGKLGFDIPDGCIGLNFSPLVGKSFLKSSKQVWELTLEDLTPWFNFCVECVVALSVSSGRPILLVPHVGSSLPGIDDFDFLKRICDAVSQKSPHPVLCIGDNLNAAESKWVISKCAVFAGARTHATIAGLSTHVPTLSFGYSVKAKGINQDIYGNQEQCIDVNNIEISKIVGAIRKLLADESGIRKYLEQRMPAVRDAALSAGGIIKELFAPSTIA